MRKSLPITFVLLFAVIIGLRAQGVTTSSIVGNITDKNGGVLPGANVVAVHEPSGSTYGSVARSDGNYTIPNVRVGGPYKITVSFVGYENQVKGEIYLTLGNAGDVNFQLVESGTQLAEILVTASNGEVFNSERTGAATNVGNTMINSIPNISRGLRDFTKLSPYANTSGSGTSFAGSNNRYNAFSIDGLVNNDVFGLAGSGTNGGQTTIEPISLDAIEEFQISMAPYDVRQGGFTGGGINAVTRSGTNKFSGSAYYFGNDESLVGQNNPNTDVKAKYPTYTDYQTGFRLGGPIIKNKLFFFINGEIARKSTPLSFKPGDPSSNISAQEVQDVRDVLTRIAPTYDPGATDNLNNVVNANKFLAKIDWNINDNHKLTVRHSYTYGEQFDITRTNNSVRFGNNGLFFPSTTNSTGIELSSRFGNKFSNRLLLGRTSVVDDRDPLGANFPTGFINLGSGRSIAFGSEGSSVANKLEQTIYSITNDFSIYSGKHTYTIGTNNEFYSFYNIFVQNIYGNYGYPSLANFKTVGLPGELAPSSYSINYSFDPTDDPSQANGAANFSAMQLGLYAQDEYQVNNRLKVTYGLRADLPIFNDKPAANTAFNDKYSDQGTTGVVPKTQVLLSPRIGFNLDVKGDKTLQLRGGIGVFTGRVPFVWVSNQYTNNGQVNGSYSLGNSSGNPISSPAGITFNPNPYTQKKAEDYGQVAGRGDINVIDPNFKFPQVFRTNIGLDKKLPWGLVGTFEAMYSKTLNNINYVHLTRVVDPTFTFAGVDQRPRYTPSNSSPTNSGFNTSGRTDPNYTEVVKLQNTDQGYTYNLVFQLQKQFDKGLTASASYTYGDGTELNNGSSSVAYSNWRNVYHVNGQNNLPLTRSSFSTGSRVVAFVSYKKAYLNNTMSTQLSLFYTGQSGQTFSYVYAGDMNNDGGTGTSSNDLIYIPKNQSDITFIPSITFNDAAGVSTTWNAQQQWDALDAFIQKDSYLSSHRGGYAERNGSRLPWNDQVDLRLTQEFQLKTGDSSHKIQLTFDIINFGNMLNDQWGRQWTNSFQAFQLINYVGLQDSDPTAGVNYSTKTPTFSYTGGGQTKGNPYNALDLASRWRAQFGLRYIFN